MAPADSQPATAEDTPLRVLIADEEAERLESLEQVVGRLGHEIVASVLEVDKVADETARSNPDVALVTLGESSGHALELIDEIVREASSPVIALLATDDREYIREAARRGVFAYVVNTSDEELQSSIEVTLQRFHEYHSLKGAFGRRALIEQAKGILMGRHGIHSDAAFSLLRRRSQASGRKVADVADALVQSHSLLPPQGRPEAGDGPEQEQDTDADADTDGGS